MPAPREGAAQAPGLDQGKDSAPTSSASLASLQVPFLRRRLANAILRGDDLAAERLREALDRALNGPRS
jgi:hypothetical protein